MLLSPAFRKLGKDLIFGVSHHFPAQKGMHLKPAAACGQVAHLAVEHGQPRWRVVDEQLQQFLTVAQLCFGLPAFGNVLNRATKGLGLSKRIELQPDSRLDPADHSV